MTVKEKLEIIIKKYDIPRSKPVGLNFYNLLEELKELQKYFNQLYEYVDINESEEDILFFDNYLQKYTTRINPLYPPDRYIRVHISKDDVWWEVFQNEDKRLMIGYNAFEIGSPMLVREKRTYKMEENNFPRNEWTIKTDIYVPRKHFNIEYRKTCEEYKHNHKTS